MSGIKKTRLGGTNRKTVVNIFEQSLFCSLSLSLELTSPLSKEKRTLVQSPPLQTASLPLMRASQAGRDTMRTFLLFFFFLPPSTQHSTLSSVSHHTIFHATSLPHSLLALNDTVYTHPASIIPFHTSPGLFICLGCWGDMKAHSLLLSLPFLPPPPTTAGCLWPLIYEGLLSPGGPV